MLEEIEKRFPSKVVEEAPKPEKKAKKEEKVEIPTLDAVVKEEITIDEFSRMELQMGEIISCEEVAKSNEAALLTGKGTGQNPADRIRNQALLYTRADGW